MNTIRTRYEVGTDTSLEFFRLWGDASVRAVAIGGYVYDRMARIGKPQLWQAVNGDLIVQSVRLPTHRTNEASTSAAVETDAHNPPLGDV